MMRPSSSAATRRHDVAMGVSPWFRDDELRLSPNGTTRGGAVGIRVAPLGLGACGDAVHELTPVATACRPVGTQSQGRIPRLVAELHAQFAESAKLEAKARAVFPSTFHESKFGHIPLGWILGRLGDLCNLKRGYDLPRSDRTAGAISVISSSGISGTHDATNVRRQGVVTGRYGPTGKVHPPEGN